MPPGQYFPAVQGEHEVAPGPVANVPAAHAVQKFVPADAAAEPAGHCVQVPAAVWLKYCPAGHEIVPERETPTVVSPPSLNCCVDATDAPNAKQTKAPLSIDGGAVNVYVVMVVVNTAVGFPDAAATHPTFGAVL